MFKKVLLSGIIFLMTFNVCFAEELYFANDETLDYSYPIGGMVFEDIIKEQDELTIQTFSAQTNLSAEEYIRRELYNHTQLINLTNYRITLSELADILSTNKDFMVASGHIVYGYEEETSVNDRIVTLYQPDYLFATKEEDAQARAFIDNSIKEYADEIKSQTDDPLARLLLLHDKLIEDCEYDTQYKLQSYSLYSFFKNKEAVCQGYAQALYFIGRELGLDVEFCRSFAISHIWNYVKLGDEYYHVDVTWDDPVVSNQSGEIVHRTTAVHTNFLKTDETVITNNPSHGNSNDWASSLETVPVCDSVKYENNYFFNIPVAFTTKLNEGNYETSIKIGTYTGSVENKTFYADELYTGPIVTSYPEEEEAYYFIYCFLTADTNKFNIFVKAENNENFVDVIKYEKTAYSKNSLTGQKILKTDLPENATDFSIYMWDMETIKPLSRVIPLN